MSCVPHSFEAHVRKKKKSIILSTLYYHLANTVNSSSSYSDSPQWDSGYCCFTTTSFQVTCPVLANNMNFEFYIHWERIQRENVTEKMSVPIKKWFIRFMSKQVGLSRFYQQIFWLFDYKHFRQLLELQNIQPSLS